MKLCLDLSFQYLQPLYIFTFHFHYVTEFAFETASQSFYIGFETNIGALTEFGMDQCSQKTLWATVVIVAFCFDEDQIFFQGGQ